MSAELTPQEFEIKMRTDFGFLLSFVVDYFIYELVKSIHQNGYTEITENNAFEFMAKIYEEENEKLVKSILNFEYDLERIPEEFKKVIQGLTK